MNANGGVATVAVRFAVARYVPDPLRGEYVNVGLLSELDGTLSFRAAADFEEIRRRTATADSSTIETALAFFASEVERAPGVPLAQVVATPRIGVLQFGEALAGLTNDPRAFLQEQFDIYVGAPRGR